MGADQILGNIDKVDECVLLQKFLASFIPSTTLKRKIGEEIILLKRKLAPRKKKHYTYPFKERRRKRKISRIIVPFHHLLECARWRMRFLYPKRRFAWGQRLDRLNIRRIHNHRGSVGALCRWGSKPLISKSPE